MPISSEPPDPDADTPTDWESDGASGAREFTTAEMKHLPAELQIRILRRRLDKFEKHVIAAERAADKHRKEDVAKEITRGRRFYGSIVGAVMFLTLPAIGVFVQVGEYRERVSVLQAQRAQDKADIERALDRVEGKLDRLLSRSTPNRTPPP